MPVYVIRPWPPRERHHKTVMSDKGKCWARQVHKNLTKLWQLTALPDAVRNVVLGVGGYDVVSIIPTLLCDLITMFA